MFPYLSKISPSARLPVTKPFMNNVSFDYDKIFHDFDILLFKRWNSMLGENLIRLKELVARMSENLILLKERSVGFDEKTYFDFQDRLLRTYDDVLCRIFNTPDRDMKYVDDYDNKTKVIYDIDKFVSYLFGVFYVNDTDTKIEFAFILWNTQVEIKLDIFRMIAIATIKYAATESSTAKSVKQKVVATSNLIKILFS